MMEEKAGSFTTPRESSADQPPNAGGVDGRLVSRASTRHPEPVTLRHHPTRRATAAPDTTHLQVGTSPGIVIDERPGLRSFLRLLNGVRDVERLRVLARTDSPSSRPTSRGPEAAARLRRRRRRQRPLVRRPRLRVALHDDAGSRPLTRAIGHVLADSASVARPARPRPVRRRQLRRASASRVRRGPAAPHQPPAGGDRRGTGPHRAAGHPRHHAMPDLPRPTHHSCRVKTGSGSSNQEAHGRSTCDCQRTGEAGDYAAGFPSSAEAFGPPRIDCRA